MTDAGSYQAVSVTKRYGATVALEEVDFELCRREIHALVGENGAGKSTLVKILTGATAPTEGHLVLGGEKRTFRSPRQAQGAGIAVVHQDNQLFPELTVWENVAATASVPAKIGPLVARRATGERVERVFEEFGIDVDPRRKVRQLAAAERKLVEIARALLLNPQFLLLDEPTATLTPDESERLVHLIQRLRQSGRGVVLVTHQLEEVLGFADRTTVLRDGRWAGTFPRTELTREVLVEAMLGGQVEHRDRVGRRAFDEAAIGVRDLRLAPRARCVEFTARVGEIVALVGLVGSGTTALLERLGGARRDLPAQIHLRGRTVRLRSSADAVRNGVGYLSRDRKTAGIVGDQSLAVNVALASLPALSRFGWSGRREMNEAAENARRRLGIRCTTTGQPMRTLSGGNQQKALVARWLLSGVSVLLVDEPTQGVDIGARADIHDHLRRFSSTGGTVVFASSDLDEVLVLADRVLILRRGEVAADIVLEERPELERADLLELMTGLSREADHQEVGA